MKAFFARFSRRTWIIVAVAAVVLVLVVSVFNARARSGGSSQYELSPLNAASWSPWSVRRAAFAPFRAPY